MMSSPVIAFTRFSSMREPSGNSLATTSRASTSLVSDGLGPVLALRLNSRTLLLICRL
ncbi:hypothetical protein D3C86_1708200 [compost metagenome]